MTEFGRVVYAGDGLSKYRVYGGAGNFLGRADDVKELERLERERGVFLPRHPSAILSATLREGGEPPWEEDLFS